MSDTFLSSDYNSIEKKQIQHFFYFFLKILKELAIEIILFLINSSGQIF